MIVPHIRSAGLQISRHFLFLSIAFFRVPMDRDKRAFDLPCPAPTDTWQTVVLAACGVSPRSLGRPWTDTTRWHLVCTRTPRAGHEPAL